MCIYMWAVQYIHTLELHYIKVIKQRNIMQPKNVSLNILHAHDGILNENK